MIPETWKPIAGYESTYEVSDCGRVRRIARRMLKNEDVSDGYKRVTLCQSNVHKRALIHRLVAAAFIGECPTGYHVNHRDGNPSNNHVSNLEYVTPAQNHQHSWRELGRKPAHMGETTPYSKLTNNDVIQIRRMRAEGMTYSAIAANFDTKPANVFSICSGQTWKHLL